MQSKKYGESDNLLNWKNSTSRGEKLGSIAYAEFKRNAVIENKNETAKLTGKRVLIVRIITHV